MPKGHSRGPQPQDPGLLHPAAGHSAAVSRGLGWLGWLGVRLRFRLLGFRLDFEISAGFWVRLGLLLVWFDLDLAWFDLDLA